MPIPVFCPPLVSTGSEPEDDTGKLTDDGKGVDPTLKREVVGDEEVVTEAEELLLLDAFTAMVLVVMLVLKVAGALMLLLLVARVELLNIF